MKLLEKLFKLIPTKLRFLAWVVIAFGAALSFIHSTSAAADSANTGVLWTVVGALLSVVTIGIGVIANSENKKDE